MRVSTHIVLAAILALVAGSALAIEKCGSGKRVTCVVDGDTLWIDGEKIRLRGYDTPEPTTGICGGDYERDLARRATERLIELLSSKEARIQRFHQDRYGRTLAKIWVEGVDVGEILISEGLARRWPDGPEFWCR